MSNLAFLNDDLTGYEAVKSLSGWEIVAIFASGKREPWWYAPNQKKFYVSLDDVQAILAKAGIVSFSVINVGDNGII
jgi:hypothetical protein